MKPIQAVLVLALLQAAPSGPLVRPAPQAQSPTVVGKTLTFTGQQ